MSHPRIAPRAVAPGVRRMAGLSPLDAQDRQALVDAAARGYRVNVRRDLVVEGHATPEPLLLLDGWAARVRILSDGRRQFMSFLLAGDLIAMCRQRAPVATSTVVTLTEVIVCAAPPAAPGSSLDQAYGISHALDEAYLLAHITRLGRMNAQERIIDLLLEFDERLALAGQSEDGRFDVPLTQEMLADALGLTSVHVNRMLQQARRDGDVSWERGRIELSRPTMLADQLGRQRPRVTSAAA